MAELTELRLALLVAHIVGLAAIIGPYLAQWRVRARFEVRIMLAGGIAQLITGLALVVVRGANETDITLGKIAAKLAVTIVIVVATVVALGLQRAANRDGRVDAASRPWFHVAGIAAIVNVAIAVLWA
jgi:hypothetical protein